MSESSVQEVHDDEAFKALIKEGVTVVDFFAEWCGPCRSLAPVIASVAQELSGQVKFAKLDIDKNHVTAKELHVTSVPTLILFKDGEEKNRLVGLRDENAVKDFALSV
ncbi:MAG: thioredoxin [Chlamydiia bacterium]|nr:thioredoxin [Chlamydiia bacterium]